MALISYYADGALIARQVRDVGHCGFVVDYLAEALRDLRKHNFTEVADRHFSMGSHLVSRDRKAVKTSSKKACSSGQSISP